MTAELTPMGSAAVRLAERAVRLRRERDAARDLACAYEAQLAKVQELLDLWISWDGTRPHPGESSPRQREQLATALGAEVDE